MRTYYLINTETGKFVETNTETFDGDWPSRYPHLAGCDWIDSPSINEYDIVNGLPYSYDLCRDGMLATLYADTTKHGAEEIRAAKAKLRRDHDVVSLRVQRITPA